MSISVERVTALINLCYCYCVQHNKVKFLRLLQRFYFTFLSSLCIKGHPIPKVLSLLVWFIPWTMAETKAYNEVLNYLRDNEYPIDFSKDQKRNLRKKALQCKVLEDGALFFIGQRKGEPKRWVHCQDEQQKTLKAFHSDKIAGHFSRDKTREKVCTKFNATCLEL